MSDKLEETFGKKDQSFQFTICGATNSGKSTEAFRIISDPKYGIITRFEPYNIFLFSKNANKDESTKKFIQEIQKYKDENDDPLFSNDYNIFTEPANFLKQIQLIQQTQNEIEPNKMQPKLLILDDFIAADVNLRCKQLSQLSTDCRHQKLSIIQIIHDMRKIDPMQIAQQTHMSIYYQKNYDRLKKIMKDICGKNYKIGMDLYDECTQERYGYLFMNFLQNDNKKYHNTIDYQYIC